VKWDGFRAIVSTEGPLRGRSRRGWKMAPHVGFLERLPVRAVLDGELVAFGADGKPDFPSLCEPMLHRHTEIPLTFLALDVLSVDGRDVRREAHRKRRRILEELGVSVCIGRRRRRLRTARRSGARSVTTNSKALSRSGWRVVRVW